MELADEQHASVMILNSYLYMTQKQPSTGLLKQGSSKLKQKSMKFT
jgi:hypothetical protein